MLADELDYVVGVDTHREAHALAVVEVVSGGVVFEATAEASGEGYAQVLRLADVHAPGRRVFAVEGTGSFGAGLACFLAVRGERVLEVGPLPRQRRSRGKTDALDAIRTARAALTSEPLALPRSGQRREALVQLRSVIVTARPTPCATSCVDCPSSAYSTGVTAFAARPPPHRMNSRRGSSCAHLHDGLWRRLPRPASSSAKSSFTCARSRHSSWTSLGSAQSSPHS